MAVRIGYVELPAAGAAALQNVKEFYARVMGWEFQDWGPEYATFSGAKVEGGINGEPDHQTSGPLVIMQIEAADSLEAIQAEVEAAGGVVTLPIFAFPGGRRFHFKDPAGNELGVLQAGGS